MATVKEDTVKVTRTLMDEAREYQALCDKARALGVPVSLDDARSPRTVAGLRAATAAASR